MRGRWVMLLLLGLVLVNFLFAPMADAQQLKQMCWDNPNLPICIKAKAAGQETVNPIKAAAKAIATFVAGSVGKLLIELTNEIFNPILGWIIGFEIVGIIWAINPATWGGFIGNDMVKYGWGFVRNFVNMGFVLAIVVIAIGFILRLQSYGSTKTLWRLIIAAILVNFSLVIAGLFIDSANILITFLTNRPGGSLADLAKNINASLDISWLQLAQEAGFSALAAPIFTTLFLFVAVIVLGAFFVMLLIRVIWLWLLLIMAPAAWLMWIFPMFESNWHRWWKDFLRWTYFAPIALFFVYLAFIFINVTNVQFNNSVTQLSSAGTLVGLGGNNPVNAPVFVNPAVASPAGTPNFQTWIARYILLIGLLIGGLTIANGMAITGANVGLQMASSAATWPYRYGKRYAKETGVKYGGAAAAKVGGRLKEFGAQAPLPLRAVSWPARSVGHKLLNLGMAAEREPLAKFEKDMEFMNDDKLQEFIDKGGVRGLAAASTMYKRGTISSVPVDKLRALMPIAQRHNRQGTILKAAPNAAAPRIDPKQVIHATPAGDMHRMHKAFMAEPQYVSQMSIPGVDDIGKNATDHEALENLYAATAPGHPGRAGLTPQEQARLDQIRRHITRARTWTSRAARDSSGRIIAGSYA